MQSILGRERNGDWNPLLPWLPKRIKSNMPSLFCLLPPSVSLIFLLIFFLQPLTVLITFFPL